MKIQRPTLKQWVKEIGGRAGELVELTAARSDTLYAKVRTDHNRAGVTVKVPENVMFTVPELNMVKNMDQFGLKQLVQTLRSGVEFWP